MATQLALQRSVLGLDNVACANALGKLFGLGNQGPASHDFVAFDELKGIGLLGLAGEANQASTNHALRGVNQHALGQASVGVVALVNAAANQGYGHLFGHCTSP
jgi:hypothetical protein